MTTLHELDEAALDAVIDLVRAEVRRARVQHPTLHSPHEGWAVIKEELDELWDHVRADTGQSNAAAKEAIQVAAMGVRYILDLCTVPR